QQGFRVEELAAHLRLGVRTLERRFRDQLRTTPKAWLIHERMSLALPLLAKRLANKQVAALLRYTCESNFTRDFKRKFGCSPQRIRLLGDRPIVSRFDRKLSCFDGFAG